MTYNIGPVNILSCLFSLDLIDATFKTVYAVETDERKITTLNLYKGACCQPQLKIHRILFIKVTC